MATLRGADLAPSSVSGTAQLPLACARVRVRTGGGKRGPRGTGTVGSWSDTAILIIAAVFVSRLPTVPFGESGVLSQRARTTVQWRQARRDRRSERRA